MKKGAALVFADGTHGIASSDDYMGMRERIVAIGGEVRGRPLTTIVRGRRVRERAGEGSPRGKGVGATYFTSDHHGKPGFGGLGVDARTLKKWAQS